MGKKQEGRTEFAGEVLDFLQQHQMRSPNAKALAQKCLDEAYATDMTVAELSGELWQGPAAPKKHTWTGSPIDWAALVILLGLIVLIFWGAWEGIGLLLQWMFE